MLISPTAVISKNGIFFSLVAFCSFLAPFSLNAKQDERLNHRFSVTGEFVYMRRSDSTDKVLADRERGCTNCDPTKVVMNTKELLNDMGFEPGFRAGIGYVENPKMAFEGNVLYLEPWEAHKTVTAAGTLYYPFNSADFATDYEDANEAQAEYKAHFWALEFNYWRPFTPRWVDYFSLSGIVGLRYFKYTESIQDSFFTYPNRSDYNIHTNNDMFGVQAGGNLQINPLRYMSWEFTGKIGFLATHGKQTTLLKDNNNTTTLRHFEMQNWQDGFFSDLTAALEFRFKDHVNLHAGYQFFYFSGITTAENQLSHKATPGSGKFIDSHGVAIIHGLFAGLTITF